MEKINIKIVKCTQPNFYWYADLVGKEYVVTRYSENLYEICRGGNSLLKDDCEIIKDIEPVRYIKSHGFTN